MVDSLKYEGPCSISKCFYVTLCNVQAVTAFFSPFLFSVSILGYVQNLISKFFTFQIQRKSIYLQSVNVLSKSGEYLLDGEGFLLIIVNFLANMFMH